MSQAERQRLDEARDAGIPWKRWGPYLSERQWGTVREDTSADGRAWDDFPHDHARSRAYRYGEDGLAGVSDDRARLCFALALWNGNDPILKERLFGLNNTEGNHGEDVKEYYYYLESTPTHAYMKYLYKYPQRAYPYADLVDTNRRRSRDEPEYELIDTGIFEDDRYFDVFVEYAKDGPDDLLVQITVHNRGPEPADLHVLPTLWFRNTWATGETSAKPLLERAAGGETAVVAHHAELGDRTMLVEGTFPLLFTENETNVARLSGGINAEPFVKDGIDRAVVHGERGAVNPAERGTKAAAHVRARVAPGVPLVVRLRLGPAGTPAAFGPAFDELFEQRRNETDAFYDTVLTAADPASRTVARQALAGMLWSKQFYRFDVYRWLDDHGVDVFAGTGGTARNAKWYHMLNDDIISMPDKWEYPWYAAWDLAMQTMPLAMIDPDFAKAQLELLLGEDYQHPNGQLPAYEWAFDDVNPPVHAFAAIQVYAMEKAQRGNGDTAFLARVFRKLLLNFTWWVNRKDRDGRNVFEGGFLGLDNIGVFDRNAPPPAGGSLEQADGSAWMAFSCLNMLEIAIELAGHDPAYEDMALKFMEHFTWIGLAMMRPSERRDAMWDEEDGFFYDVLRYPDGHGESLRIRSLVGLLPICATLTLTPAMIARVPTAAARALERLGRIPEIATLLPSLGRPGHDGNVILSFLDETKLRRVLARLLDENEFLSPYGVRSLSKYHDEHPYTVSIDERELCVSYLPADSNLPVFGGNSNWRGPVWFPTNAMIYRALLQFYRYYGDAFTIECPTGSGHHLTLFEVALELGRRLQSIFLPDASGRRPVFGGAEKFQTDPEWRDYLLFYEFFHGDNGAGIGASHQTGWTGLIAFMGQFRTIGPEAWLAHGRDAMHVR